ncbi:hypothetical protein G3I13_01880 [Streptomyces sp. SID6673]|nr:hypothetical protein [Streptomyces sp. SID11726]NDZ94910.1 hypothetical protein [Streptomyces sp. SID11726]NEB23070.1 hypothetical protein [Streptomyces sp. SID6673]
MSRKDTIYYIGAWIGALLAAASAVISIGFATGGITIVDTTPELTGRAATTEAAPERNTLERLINEQRQEHDLPALKSNAALRESACAKAGHMNTEDYFDHVAPDGTQPWSFFEEAGYGYTHAGENLARNFSDDAELVQAWMDSPTHRENVLGEYEEQGICTVGAYTVEHLGVRG